MKRVLKGLAVFLGIMTGFLIVLFSINPERPGITGNVVIEGQGPIQVIGNLLELKFNDTENAAGERWARGGISLPNGTGIFTDDKIQILEFNTSDGNYYEHDADVWIQTRRGGQINDTSKEVWFVGYTFKIDELDSDGKSFFVHYGVNVNRGNSGNFLTISDIGNLLRVQNSSGLIYDINKTGFDIFNRIDLGGQEIISSGNSNGFVVRDSNGINYSTANSVSVITVEEDGKVHKALRIEGNFTDTSGNDFLGYVARMFLYHDGKSELSIILQNKGDYDRNVNAEHKRFKTMYADLELNLGNQKDLILTEFYNITFTTERFRAYQDFNVSTQDHSALSYGQDPTNDNMIDNFYVRVLDNSENTVYLEADELEGQDGTRSNGLVAVSDGDKKFVVAVEDFWRDSPKTIEVENNRVKIGLFGEEHETTNYLVHDQGPILKTYTGNTQYDHNTFQGSSYTNYATEDLGNYILHKGVQEYEKMFFDFSFGGIDLSEEINFSKGVQTQTIGLANGSYYRLSGANANRFRYFEDRNFNLEDLNQTTKDAGIFMGNWQKSLWDDSYVTQPISGYSYLPSLVNRIKMGTDASGSFGRPHYGWPYSGQLFWQGEGWMNNGFGSVNGIITAIMRSEDHKGFSELDNVIKHNSIDAMYVWENPGDIIAGSTRHEKGNVVYGFYQNTNPNSPRHQWEDLIPVAKLFFADENMKESLLYSTVDFASGYPHVATGQAGNNLGIITLANSVGKLGPLGPQLKNLVGYYQLTGDTEYVRIAKEYVKTLKAISEKCEEIYGVKIIHSPSINQNINQSGQNQGGGDFNCTPANNNQEQFFMVMYYLTGAIEVLEADYQINGEYDSELKDFFVESIGDYYQYLVKPYVPVQPESGYGYTPITTYNNYNIKTIGTTPANGCIFNSNLSNGYELHQCNSGEMTGTAMMGGEILPWLYYQTNVTEYLDSAEIITRDNILYRSRGGLSGLNVSFGNPGEYGSIAWRHLSTGVADVKIFMPQLWKFLPFFNVKLGGVGESIGTNQTVLSCSGSLSCSQVGVCSGTQSQCLNLNWVCDYSGNNVAYESTESLCSDGLDNDCDGFVDLEDSDCSEGTGGTGGSIGSSSSGGSGGSSGGSSGTGNVVSSPETNVGNEEGTEAENEEGGEGAGVGAGITGLFVDEDENLKTGNIGFIFIAVISGLIIGGIFWVIKRFG